MVGCYSQKMPLKHLETWKVMMEVVGKNFKFLEEKFVMEPNAKFAGLDLATNPKGRVTIKPD